MGRIIALCTTVLLLLAAGAGPLFAEEFSVQIRLGIRDDKYIPAAERIACPLSFQIPNVGKKVIGQDDVIKLFFKGVLHALPEHGKEQRTAVQPMWRTAAEDLRPGQVSESPDYANLLDFFPSLKDGDYEVWWTLEKSKSNALHFTVKKRKLSLQPSKT